LNDNLRSLAPSSCLLLLALLLQSAPARAQGFIIPELGRRANGMGAAVGRPDELAAIYHNPGALALLEGTQMGLSFGAVFLNTDIRLAPWHGSEKLISDPVDSAGYYPRETPSVFAAIPFLGASTKLWSDKVVGAVGVYVPNAAGATFGEDAPSRYHIIDALVFSAFFTGAVAYRPWRWLAVGVGASAVYIQVSRRFLLDPVIDGIDYSSLLGTKTEVQLEGTDVQPAFSLGIQAWPHRTVSLGFMMLSRYDVSLEGPLRLKPGSDSSSLVQKPAFTENQQRTEVVAPWIFGFGANWDITPWLEVGAEFRLYLNSLIEKQVTTLTSGEVLPSLLKNGFVTPKNLHDSFHTGGGVKVRPPLRRIDLELMTGVHFDNSASPNNTIEVSAPSFDLLAFHFGGRWRINRHFGVSLLYTHYWYFERTTTDSITSPPTNFVGSANANMLTLVLEGSMARGIGVR
jgi:long-subunit fatty acid transport protein